MGAEDAVRVGMLERDDALELVEGGPAHAQARSSRRSIPATGMRTQSGRCASS
jgi:hypothetical protein